MPDSASSSHPPPAVRLLVRGGRVAALWRTRVRVLLAAPVRHRRARRRAMLAAAALVVAGDDRQARDLAADLRAWLAPRPVRFYPSRGVTYESHLAPPPHLVGLRVAALDALLGDAPREGEPPVVVVSAVALCEKVPDPELRPHSFTLRVGDLLDLDEVAADLVAAGYERVDQVEDRGQFAIRGGSSTSTRPPRTAPSASTCSTSRSSRCAGSRRSRSARSARPTQVEIAPGGRARRRAPRAGRDRRAASEDERPDVAELLPVDRFRAFLDLVRRRRRPRRRRGGGRAGAARPLAGRLRRLPRRRRPPPLRRTRTRPRRRSTRARASALSAHRPPTSPRSSARRPPTSPRAR